MNIAQALKNKNRLAGKIAQLQAKVIHNNRFTNLAPASYDMKELLRELDESNAELILLKTKIQVANTGIAGELVEISELKGHLKHLEMVKAYSLAGPVTSYQSIGRDATQEVVTQSQITLAEVEAQIEKAQTRVNDLQDRIDAFNATTSV